MNGFVITVALGALSGLTIFLGLATARWGRPGVKTMSFCVAASVGVLLFILYDVLKNAGSTIETALSQSTASGLTYAAVLVAGLSVSLLGLTWFEHSAKRRAAVLPVGPGSMLATELTQSRWTLALSPAYRTALLIAVGIGLHNFSEGLAIGQASAQSAFRLFALLVIGFGLHNATEGFGITAPLLGQRPTWGFLSALGLIGGGPTFLGAIVGYQFTSALVSVLFLALAAGAIMYVIGELQHAGRKIGAHDLGMVGLLCGFVAAFGTDLLLKVAGS